MQDEHGNPIEMIFEGLIEQVEDWKKRIAPSQYVGSDNELHNEDASDSEKLRVIAEVQIGTLVVLDNINTSLKRIGNLLESQKQELHVDVCAPAPREAFKTKKEMNTKR